mgnify:CR=1 FL=1
MTHNHMDNFKHWLSEATVDEALEAKRLLEQKLSAERETLANQLSASQKSLAALDKELAGNGKAKKTRKPRTPKTTPETPATLPGVED